MNAKQTQVSKSNKKTKSVKGKVAEQAPNKRIPQPSAIFMIEETRNGKKHVRGTTPPKGRAVDRKKTTEATKVITYKESNDDFQRWKEVRDAISKPNVLTDDAVIRVQMARDKRQRKPKQPKSTKRETKLMDIIMTVTSEDGQKLTSGFEGWREVKDFLSNPDVLISVIEDHTSVTFESFPRQKKHQLDDRGLHMMDPVIASSVLCQDMSSQDRGKVLDDIHALAAAYAKAGPQASDDSDEVSVLSQDETVAAKEQVPSCNENGDDAVDCRMETVVKARIRSCNENGDDAEDYGMTDYYAVRGITDEERDKIQNTKAEHDNTTYDVDELREYLALESAPDDTIKLVIDNKGAARIGGLNLHGKLKPKTDEYNKDELVLFFAKAKRPKKALTLLEVHKEAIAKLLDVQIDAKSLSEGLDGTRSKDDCVKYIEILEHVARCLSSSC